MVTGDNNNKFYEMAENGDGTFTASYGRIGAPPATQTYPLARWEAKYREKVRKGYADVSALCADGDERGPRFSIDDPSVAALIEALARYAADAIQARYLVGAGQVTAQQVAEAQAHVDTLAALAGASGLDVDAFNAELLALYTAIPRRMGDVRAHLLGSGMDPTDAERVRALLEREQEALDVMATEVRQVTRREDGAAPPTLRDALGLTIARVTDGTEVHRIRSRMGGDASRFRAAYRVVDHRRAELFDRHVRAESDRRTRLLWHGSRNENWLSILENGLMLRPARAVITGKMFGYGLYFAERMAKSLNYTSLQGACWSGGRDRAAYLALYEVHLGRPLRITTWEPWCATLDAEEVARRGPLWWRCHSVHGFAGLSLRHDEFVVYREVQATIRYLIEIAL